MTAYFPTSESVRNQKNEEMKTKIYISPNREIVVIAQSESYPDGRGRKKWDRHIVVLDKKLMEKLQKVANTRK